MLPLGTGCWHLCRDLCERFAALLDWEGFPGGPIGEEPACQSRRPKRPGGGVVVRSLGGGDPLEAGIATQLLPIRQYSCLENPHGQRSLGGYSPYRRTRSDRTEAHAYIGKRNLQRERVTYDFFHPGLSSWWTNSDICHETSSWFAFLGT